MLSLGWSELLIVAAVALIVVGPADLPGMLRNLGRAAGAIRRMGNEFRAELNKVAAVDDIREARRSLTDPLRAASREITKEFNRTDGDKISPTGAIKPKVEGSESVADEIREAAGVKATDKTAAAPAMVPVKRAGAKRAGARSGAKTSKSGSKPTARASSNSGAKTGRTATKSASKAESKAAATPKPTRKPRTRRTTAKKPT